MLRAPARHRALLLISHFSLLSSPLPLLRDLRDLRDLREKMPWRKLSRCTSAFACFASSRELLLVYVVFGGVEASAERCSANPACGAGAPRSESMRCWGSALLRGGHRALFHTSHLTLPTSTFTLPPSPFTLHTSHFTLHPSLHLSRSLSCRTCRRWRPPLGRVVRHGRALVLRRGAAELPMQR